MKAVIKFFIFIFILNTCINTIAQNRITDTSATCIAFWKNKETKVYNIKHTKEKTDHVKGNVISEVSYDAYIKVIDSATEGFTLEWVYKNFKTTGVNEPVLNSVNALMEGLKIIYKTDAVGTFKELINWKEVRNFAITNYEKAIANSSSDKEFIAALNQIKSIFQSKENIETLLIKEVQLYHTPYGVEYNIKGTSMETELPNVTGGEPFPASITYKLNELNKKENYIKVSLSQTINKDKSAPIIAAMLKKLSGNSNDDENEIKRQIKDLDIRDTNEFTYAIKTGWLARVFYQRTSSTGNVKQIETYDIIEKK